MEFIPDSLKDQEQEIPYFENISAKDVPGRGAEKPVEFYQKQIRELLARLGAGLVTFTLGKFPGKPLRYGYQITFNLGGIPGRIDCAALPMRSETAKKKDRALAQALFLVRDWLQAEVYSSIYRPGAIPLVPYLIGAGGKTVTEELIARKMLPELTPYRIGDGQ